MSSDTAPSIVWLDDHRARDVALVGAKAAHLAELRQTGLPVPNGFVLTSAAYQPDHAVPPDLVASIEGAYAALDHGVVAVRSSSSQEDLATASFAGQYETVLGVQGVAAVLAAIETCWHSAHSERSTAYRARSGLGETGTMAVLVQQLIDADAAGVMFTLNPHNGAERETVIEAAWGLGQGVVDGSVSPDRYVVDSFEQRILERHIATKRIAVHRGAGGTTTIDLPMSQATAPALSDDQISALTQLGDEIHAFYGAPQDIEWALHAGTLWVLQARPLTAFHFSTIPGQWTSANFREVQPGCATPISFSLGFAHAYSQAMADFFARVRLTDGPRPDLSPAALIYGHAYWRTDHVKGRAAEMPTFKERAFDKTIGIVPTYEGDGYVPGWNWTTIRRALPVLPALHRGYAQAWREAAAYREAFLAAEPARRAVDVAALDDAGLRDYVREMIDLHWRTNKVAITATLFSLQAQDDFHPLLQSLNNGLPADQQISEGRLMTGLSALNTAAPLTDLWALAQQAKRDVALVEQIAVTPVAELHAALQTNAAGQALAAALDAYLARYFYLSTCDEDLLQPRWDEDPTVPLTIFKQFVVGEYELESPLQRELRQYQLREVEEARLERALRRGWRRLDPVTPLLLWYQLNIVRRYIYWRENLRDIVGIVWWYCRRAFQAQGQRWAHSGYLGQADDIFWLLREELLAALDGSLSSADAQRLVATRQHIAHRYRNWTPPGVVGEFKLFGSAADVSVTPHASASPEADSLQHGLACSPGVVIGRARVLHSLDQAASFAAGEILIAPYTNPGWTPLFSLAAAVVMEEGGLLSHGAVVARECGIPAVLQILDATQIYATGDLLRVDGQAGTVERLSGNT